MILQELYYNNHIFAKKKKNICVCMYIFLHKYILRENKKDSDSNLCARSSIFILIILVGAKS